MILAIYYFKKVKQLMNSLKKFIFNIIEESKFI